MTNWPRQLFLFPYPPTRLLLLPLLPFLPLLPIHPDYSESPRGLDARRMAIIKVSSPTNGGKRWSVHGRPMLCPSDRVFMHTSYTLSARPNSTRDRSTMEGKGQRLCADPATLSLSPPSSLPHFLVCRSRSFFSPLHPCPHPPLPNPGATHGGGGAATVCTCNCSSGRAHKRVQLNGWKEGVGLKKKIKKEYELQILYSSGSCPLFQGCGWK